MPRKKTARPIDEPFEVSQDTLKPAIGKLGKKPKKVATPITPGEVVQAKKDSLPPEVIEAFNELIAKNWSGHSATVKQKEVAALIASKLGLDNTNPVYDNHWLDVEDVFRKQGWKVDYDKPGYCESYEATFEFKK